MLNKDQIFSAKDRQRQWLPLPEWTPDGEQFDETKHGVFVGSMSARDKDYFERLFIEQGGRDNARAKLAVLTVQDENGNRLFTDADAERLGQKDAGPLSKIFDAALKVNRMAKGDHEELTKNS